MAALKERLSRVREHVLQETDGSLRDRVYRALRAAILGRDLVGGDRVTEVDLASTLEVSRTPLREAFRLLQAEGLVSLSDRRGIVVRGLDVQDYLEIYEIRSQLDALVARKAAQSRSPEFINKLRDNIEMSEFLLERERWTELREQFFQFHQLLQDACGNTRLRDLLEDLLEYSNSSTAFRTPTPQHAPSTLADHAKIFKAIKAGDADAAAAAAATHVANERAEMLRVQDAVTQSGEVPVRKAHAKSKKVTGAVTSAKRKSSGRSTRRAR